MTNESTRIIQETFRKNVSASTPLDEGAKLKMPKSEEEARTQAVDWQNGFASKSMSWGEVLDAQEHFEKTGKKFKITKEFKENGII